MGIGMVARAVSTMFVFPLASKYLSDRKLALFLVVSSLISVVLYIPMDSYSTLLIVTVLFSLFYPSLLPAVENSATTLIQQGSVHYGKSRSYGSIAFVISVLLLSLMIGLMGEAVILWSMIAYLVVMLLLQAMPAPEILNQKPSAEDRLKYSMKSLWKVKGFPAVLAVVTLLQGSLASYYNYSYIYLQDSLDVNPFYIGMILNVAVLFEILFFLKADQLFSKWKTSSMLLLAAAGSTLRWVMIFAVPNVWAFILSQTMHALAFALAHYAFIQYITRILPKQQLANAQGLYSALAMSLSAAVLTLLGGALYDILPGLAFLGMTAATVPAIILILLTRNYYRY